MTESFIGKEKYQLLNLQYIYLWNKIIFLNGSQHNVEGNKDKFISECKHKLIFY